MKEPFEKFIYPDFSFNLYGNKEKYRQDLISKFPDEKNAIKQYFIDVKAAVDWSAMRNVARSLPAPARMYLLGLCSLKQSFYLNTTKEYMDKKISDQKLKALLTTQWLNYGLPPSKSAFLTHAAVVFHYQNGGYYPEGGSGKIVEYIEPVIKKYGGNILCKHFVNKIIIKKHRAIGVDVTINNEKNKQFFAPVIISNAGVFNTYNRLLPPSYGKKYAKGLNNDSDGTGPFVLYLGLKKSPSSIGIMGENQWIYNSYDHDSHG